MRGGDRAAGDRRFRLRGEREREEEELELECLRFLAGVSRQWSTFGDHENEIGCVGDDADENQMRKSGVGAFRA